MVSEILCNLHLSITYQAYGTRAFMMCGFFVCEKGAGVVENIGVSEKRPRGYI